MMKCATEKAAAPYLSSPQIKTEAGPKLSSIDSWAALTRKSQVQELSWTSLEIFTAPPAAGASRSATVRYSNSRQTPAAVGRKAFSIPSWVGRMVDFPALWLLTAQAISLAPRPAAVLRILPAEAVALCSS